MKGKLEDSQFSNCHIYIFLNQDMNHYSVLVTEVMV